MGTASALKRTDLSQLDYTFDLLYSLSDEDLEAVQAVAIALNRKRTSLLEQHQADEILAFAPQSEEQLIRRIDHAIAQIETGEYSDAEDVEEELLSEIGA